MATLYRNKTFVCNRGDTFILPVDLNIGTGVNPIYYDMVPGDVVYFGLCEPNQKFEHAILKKVFRYDDWRLCNKCCELDFSTEDTENLLPGNYYYEVKLYREKDPNCHNNESVTTVVPKTKFTILE